MNVLGKLEHGGGEEPGRRWGRACRRRRAAIGPHQGLERAGSWVDQEGIGEIDLLMRPRDEIRDRRADQGKARRRRGQVGEEVRRTSRRGSAACLVFHGPRVSLHRGRRDDDIALAILARGAGPTPTRSRRNGDPGPAEHGLMSATISGRIRWAISWACSETVSRSPEVSFGIDLRTRWLQPGGGPSPSSCTPASSWQSRAAGNGPARPDNADPVSLASRELKSLSLIPDASASMQIPLNRTRERRVLESEAARLSRGKINVELRRGRPRLASARWIGYLVYSFGRRETTGTEKGGRQKAKGKTQKGKGKREGEVLSRQDGDRDGGRGSTGRPGDAAGEKITGAQSTQAGQVGS